MTQDLHELPHDRVDFWFAYADTLPAEAASRYRHILSASEDERYARFYFDRDRHVYLLAHVLLRLALSSYAPVPPAQWTFNTGRYGKPSLDGPVSLPLEFNLSHTRGVVCCALTMQNAIGADMQVYQPAGRMLDLATRVYGASELKALKEQVPSQRDRDATMLWSLKEAFAKALGLGIRLPFRQLEFSLPDSAPARLHAAPEPHDPREWRFACLHLRSEFSAAIALQCTSPGPMLVRAYQLVGEGLTGKRQELPLRPNDAWEL